MEQWVRGWGVKSNESWKDVNQFPDHCLYDVIPRAFGNIMASKHIANASVADCQDECENYVTEDGHRCLGFNFNDVIQTCGLMTGENLFRLDKHHRPSPVHRLFIRRCEIQGIYQKFIWSWWYCNSAQQNYTFLTDSPNLLYLLGIHHSWVYCEYKMLALICCQRDCDKL